MQHEDRRAAKQSEQQTKWSEQDQRDLDDFARAMFSTRQGRRYALWLLDISNGMGLGEVFTTNALLTSLNCGAHNVGKQIWSHMLEAAPEEFFKALKEQASERDARNKALGNAGNETDDDRDKAG